MKKMMIAVLASFAISSFAMAGEEIQLAAAIGSGASETGLAAIGGGAAGAGAGDVAAYVAIGASFVATMAEAGATTVTNH